MSLDAIGRVLSLYGQRQIREDRPGTGILLYADGATGDRLAA